MRLTPSERHHIRAATLAHFGVVPLLFGSRADDTRRGGDIDLYVQTALSADEAEQRRSRLWVDLQMRLGEQKIDIVVAPPGSQRSIDLAALQQGVPV